MGRWKLHRGTIAFFGVLIVAIVVGVIVGSGAGTTITAIAAGLFALTLLATGGGAVLIGREPIDRRRPGPPPEDEDQRDPPG